MCLGDYIGERLIARFGAVLVIASREAIARGAAMHVATLLRMHWSQSLGHSVDYLMGP
jgi:hypothetical protein